MLVVLTLALGTVGVPPDLLVSLRPCRPCSATSGARRASREGEARRHLPGRPELQARHVRRRRVRRRRAVHRVHIYRCGLGRDGRETPPAAPAYAPAHETPSSGSGCSAGARRTRARATSAASRTRSTAGSCARGRLSGSFCVTRAPGHPPRTEHRHVREALREGVPSGDGAGDDADGADADADERARATTSSPSRRRRHGPPRRARRADRPRRGDRRRAAHLQGRRGRRARRQRDGTRRAPLMTWLKRSAFVDELRSTTTIARVRHCFGEVLGGRCRARRCLQLAAKSALGPSSSSTRRRCGCARRPPAGPRPRARSTAGGRRRRGRAAAALAQHGAHAGSGAPSRSSPRAAPIHYRLMLDDPSLEPAAAPAAARGASAASVGRRAGRRGRPEEDRRPAPRARDRHT